MESEILKIAHISTTDLGFILAFNMTKKETLWIDKEEYNKTEDIRKFLKDFKRDVYLLLNDKIDYITVEYSEVKY